MTRIKGSAYRICTGAHFFDTGIFSGLGKDEMSPVHFYFPKGTLNSVQYSEPSVEDALIVKESQFDLTEFINGLPWFLREVTYLHFYRNLTIKQIAKLLNKPVPLIQGWLAHSIYWLKIFVLKFKPPE